MSAIHYKFRAAKDYDTYRFEGAGIPVWELKNEILEAKKLGRSDDFDLVITNAQTNQEYTEETDIIPRNTSVLVKRVPVPKGTKRRIPTGSTTYFAPTLSQSVLKSVTKTDAPTGAKEEDEKIRKMMAESSSQWAHSQAASVQTTAPRRPFRPKPTSNAPIPPPTYVCFRCGQSGHYINHCPTNADPSFDRPRIKRTTGIPRAFLRSVDPSLLDTAPSAAIMLTEEGAAVIAAPNEQEWDRLAAERKRVAVLMDIPDELKCPICHDLFAPPISMISCCSAVFCDDCVRTALTEESAVSAGRAHCPVCRKPATLQSLRLAPIDVQSKLDDFLSQRNTHNVVVTSSIKDSIDQAVVSPSQPDNDKNIAIMPSVIPPAMHTNNPAVQPPQYHVPPNALPTPPPQYYPYQESLIPPHHYQQQHHYERSYRPEERHDRRRSRSPRRHRSRSRSRSRSPHRRSRDDPHSYRPARRR